MGPHHRTLPPGWRTALLLFLMAGSILVIGHRLDQGGDPRPGAPPARREHRDPPSAASARSRVPGTPAPSPAGEAAGLDPPAADAAGGDLGRPARWLSGRVLDAGGRPISGVEVSLGEQRAATDSAGGFLLLQGSDDLLLRHPDFFPRAIDLPARRSLALSTGDPAQSRLLLAMFPGGRIRGRVAGADGRPLEGVEVRFVDSSGRAPPLSAPPAATAADGTYASPLLRPGPHRLLFRHPDYQGAEAAIALPAGELEARCDVALHPGDPLLVRVADREGAGLPDAGIWLLPPPADRGASPRYLGATGDRGLLEGRRDPRLHRRLRAVLAGYREVEVPIDGARLELRLEPAAALAGTAVDRRTGLPVDITAIQLEIETPEGFRPSLDRGVLFRPFERGKFLAGLPPFPGTYRAAIRAPGDLLGYSDAVTFDGESAPPNCTVRLDHRGTLEGVVLYRDRPLEGVLVELYSDASLPVELPSPEEAGARLRFAGGIQLAAREAPLRSQVTGAGGKFRFEELPAENYRIRATHSQLAELYSPPIGVPAPGPMPLSMSRGGALRGAVRGPTDEPEAGIPLMLVREGFPFPRLSASDASGGYEFLDLFPGSYHLIVGEPSAAAEEAAAVWMPPPAATGPPATSQGSIRISAGGEETLEVRLVDPSWGWIHGRITVDGSPLAGAVLSWRGPLAPAAASAIAGSAGGALPERRAATDASGSFRILGLDPGAYRVRSEVPPIDWLLAVEGGRKTSCAADLHTFPFTARLFRRRAGTPVLAADGEIRLEPSGAVVHQGPFIEGALPPLRLFPGAYRLHVQAAGFLPRRERFAVRDREEDLSLEMTPAIRIRIERPYGPETSPEASRLPRGLTEVLLLRSGVEVHRASAVVEDEVLIPELEPGTYELILRNSRGAAHSRFEVLESGPGSQ